MTKNNKVFSDNMKAFRAAKKLTQEKAAELLGVKRARLGAWEEGRCFPSLGRVAIIARVYGIADWMSFTSVEKYQNGQPVKQTVLTQLQESYQLAPIKEKLAVNILLGLVDLDS